MDEEVQIKIDDAVCYDYATKWSVKDYESKEDDSLFMLSCAMLCYANALLLSCLG